MREDNAAKPVLVLTGGPAAGKSATALALSDSTPRCAFIDVDDIRQLVKTGGAAPWEGEEGLRQQALGVRNACALAKSFTKHGFAAIVADVLTPETARLYRRLLPDVVLVHLTLSREEARRRASLRPMHITSEEFEALHEVQVADPPRVDVSLEVTSMSPAEQVEAVRDLWVSRCYTPTSAGPR
ncbi:phosphotransferase-like protein [Oryzihumus leptocrescens]|uniref:Gluconate kinase n=1 Tax=Oryzihumus leptocrescens TaxID=297536 RepID=A0A542ZEW9_9MICO|nr:hypothetical protein [Oryzihumus leptocrescens]TQL58896.1 gluconate kinase [Oryzihumus leptocrescens]